MTKRRMKVYIVVGVFVLFMCATVMNYMSASADVSDQMQDVWNLTYGTNLLNEYDENFADRRLNDFFMDFSNSCNPTRTTSVKPAYAFAMVDTEGNVLFKSESGVWWATVEERGNGYNYISLEEYLTDDIKKEIARMYKKAKKSMLMLDMDCSNLYGQYKNTPMVGNINF